MLVGVFTTSAIQSASAQSSLESAFDNSYIFWGYPNMYLNYQAKIAFPLIDQMLQANPPKTEVNSQRRLALTTLDLFLHDAEYERRDALYSFINTRLSRVLSSLKETMTAGVRIYKFYNCGFIIQSAKTTIAVDIVPGGASYKPCIHDSILYELVDYCDALLITNSDEANKKVATIFINSGKKVLAPDDVLTNLDGIDYVGTSEEQTMEIGGMTLHVMPGHNDKKSNNIYIMDFKSGIVAHTGAQDNDDDWERIDQVKSKYKTDVLLTKSQNVNLESMLAGFKPGLVITMGENLLTSSVDRRESYWTTQKRLQDLAQLAIPDIVMTWGERYDIINADTEETTSTKAVKKMIDGVMYIKRNGNTYNAAGMKVN